MDDKNVLIEFGLKVNELISDLKQVAKRLDDIDEREEKLKNKDPFSKNNEAAKAYNRTLADNTKIYQQVQASAKAYEKELDRLKAIQTDLNRQMVNFKSGQQYDKVKGDLDAVNMRIREVSQGLTTFNGSVTQSSSLMDKLTSFAKGAAGVIGGLFIADKALAFEGEIFNVTAKYEAYRSTLQNATQDELATAEAMDMVANVAIKSNFTVDELTNSYIKLVNRGIVPTREELIKQGDLAASQGKGFDQLTEAILDAMTNEYERLKEFGIKAKTIGDTVSLTFKGITKEIDKMDGEGIQKAILSFGELQGVAGSMSATSTTLNGQLSAMSDNWEQILKNLGEGQSGIFHSTVTFLADMVGWLKEATAVPFDKKLRDEKIELNSLVDSIIASNDNAAVRNNLMNTLIQKYPSILRYIDGETTSNQQLLNALKLINAEYERKIRLAARSKIADDALTGATDSEIKVQNFIRTLTSENKGNKQYFEQLLKENGVTYDTFLTALPKQQKEIINKVQKSFKNRAGGGIGSFMANIGLGSDFEKALFGINNAVDESIKKQTEYNKVMVDNEKINQSFAKQDEARIKAEQAKIDLLKASNKVNGEQYSTIKSNLELQVRQLASDISQTAQTKQNAQALKDKNKQLQLYNKELEYMNKNASSGTIPESLRKRLINDMEKPLQGYKDSLAGKPAVPTVPRDKVAGPNEPATNNEKDRQQELQKLLKLQEDYKQKLSDIVLDTENIRLSMLDKKSEEYIEARKKYDLELIEQERKKLKELYDIQKGEVVTSGKDEKGNPTFKLATRTEVLVSKGKSKEQADAQVNSEFSADSPQILALIEQKKQKVLQDSAKDVFAIRKEDATKLLNLQNDSLQKELDLLKLKLDESLEVETENDNLRAAIYQKYLFDKELVKKKFADKELQAEQEFIESSLDLLKRQEGESKEDFEKRLSISRLEIKVDFAQKAIDAEMQYQMAMLEMSKASGKELTDEEKKNYDSRLKLLQLAKQKASKELNELNSSANFNFQKYSSVWDLTFKELAIKFSDNPELDGAIKESIERSMATIGEGLKAMLDAEAEASKERLDSYEQDLTRKEELLNDEIEKEKNGYANSVAEKRADVEETKKLRDDEKEHYRKVQKERATIESLEIIGAEAVTLANMIASASQVIKDWSKIPFAGVAIGIAAAVSLVATFASVKSKFKAANKLRKGQRLMDGRSHENGGMDVVDTQTGDVLYNIEKREWLMGTEPSEKYDELLGHINYDTFRRLPAAKQMKLLSPLGINLHESNMLSTKKGIAEYNYVHNVTKNKQSDISFAEMVQLMTAIKENTSNLDESIQFVGNDKFVKIKKGKIVGVKHEKV